MAPMFNEQQMPEDALTHMQRLFIERLHPLYLRFDQAMRLRAVWGDREYYGFENLKLGDEADKTIDFLVGVSAGDELDLPIVQTPNGQPVSIQIRPEKDELCVLILDALLEHERQTEIQQKSNEVQLLSRRQQKLMEELKETQFELDQRRQEAEAANRLKSEFISNMSHEFRTPLTSVLGYTELLEKTLQNERSKLHQLNAISRGAKHLLSLIENLLDHGRLEEDEVVLQTRPLDVAALREDLLAIFKPLAERKGLQFEVEMRDFPEAVLIDDMRFRQVLINLIGNGVKFTDEGAVTAKLRWEDSRIDIEVRDTGPGIPEQAQARIFRAFQRAVDDQESGAGLGLAISSRLVALLGGELVLAESDSHGSVFRFSVNAPDAGESKVGDRQTEVAESSDNSTGQAAKVLLAEDDDDIAQLVALLLDDAGYSVERARNGREAIDFALASNPDVLLIDMNMPLVNGVDAVRELRLGGFSHPIVALTASASADYKRSALTAGCNEYLVKPVDSTTLINTVATMVQNFRGSNRDG